METYTEQKARHSKEFGEFEGIFFAFSNEQLAEGMVKIGLAVDDYKSVISIGAGGYMLRTQISAYKELCARHNQERKDLKRDEAKLVDAIVYELSNHEYCITGDPSDALNALGLTIKSVSPAVLKRAIKKHNELVIV